MRTKDGRRAASPFFDPFIFWAVDDVRIAIDPVAHNRLVRLLAQRNFPTVAVLWPKIVLLLHADVGAIVVAEPRPASVANLRKTQARLGSKMCSKPSVPIPFSRARC